MIKGIFILASMVFITSCFAQENNESIDIKMTCLNYLEGWYSGNADRMEKALHANLIKRRKITLKKTGRDLINQATANDMIEYTEAKMGLKENATQNIEIIILDIYNEIATVKTVTSDFIDYIHLVKFNSEWTIINVLWDVKK